MRQADARPGGRLAPCSRPSMTLRAALTRGGLRPSLTAAPRGVGEFFRPERGNGDQTNKETSFHTPIVDFAELDVHNSRLFCCEF